MDRNSNKKNPVMEQWMDSAACDAIGANTAVDSAAYQRELEAAAPASRQVDRELRETVAMLSAASPYMEPPEDLRGRVLQATAPASFRMEDYRKVNRESGTFYRWGFYAAMLCLMAGAWYNLSLKSSMSVTQSQLEVAKNQTNERNAALEAILNPNADQITFREDGKVIGKAFRDEKNMTAVVILPEGMVPPGKAPQLSINKDGEQVPYKTVLVTVPAGMLGTHTGKSVDSVLAIKDMAPDPRPAQIAGK
jgi:hypothetical protein